MKKENKGSEGQESKNYSFFSHTSCEYFPCHKGVSREDFNCLFCYCPLYVLGEKCGGSPRILENGIKDCSSCNFPHHRENYNDVLEKLKESRKISGK